MNNFLPKTYYLKPTTGFTLIELLIAMGLFLSVLVIASGTFIESLKSQRAAAELIAVNDNMSAALELIAREIRVGSEFSVPNAAELHFNSAAGKKIIYRLNDADRTIEKSIDGGIFERVTATNVMVHRLTFVGAGLGANDKKQARITVALEVGGKSKNMSGVTTHLETTISPRNIDG